MQLIDDLHGGFITQVFLKEEEMLISTSMSNLDSLIALHLYFLVVLKNHFYQEWTMNQEHSYLLPPSESTYALHEIIHVCSQIEETGPPRFNCLFMFERVNLFFKRMIKNKHHHMASIIKSYASEEFICQTVGFNFKCLTKVVEIMSCIERIQF